MALLANIPELGECPLCADTVAKVFLTARRNFLGPLVRSARRDVSDLIVSHKNDQGPPYRSYRALQQWKHRRFDFGDIFGVLRFSTFATVSAKTGHPKLRFAKPQIGSHLVIPGSRLRRCQTAPARRRRCRAERLHRT
jgi:hypothetical protein